MGDDYWTAGVSARKVDPGWQGILKHGDGTATKSWAPTEDEAKERVMEEAI